MRIEFHALQFMPYSNVNRDDSGAPKTLLIGDTLRARWSSASMKRRFRSGLDLDASRPQSLLMGTRTRWLPERAVESICQERSLPEADVRPRVAAVFSSLGGGIKTEVKDYGTGNRKRQVTRTQVALLCRPTAPTQVPHILATRWDDITFTEKTEGRKTTLLATIPTDVQSALLDQFTGTDLLDVAMFGRFLVEIPKGVTDGAVSVAHAHTTHEISWDFDYWTAVDDQQRDDDSGAGMMGTAPYTNGVFYRYASVDLGTLHKNLPDTDEVFIAEAVRAFGAQFLHLRPEAKARGTAPFTDPALALAVVQPSTPVSLAGAFADAIPANASGGLTFASAHRLAEHWNTLTGTYRNRDGAPRHTAAFLLTADPNLTHLTLADADRVDTDQALLDAAIRVAYPSGQSLADAALGAGLATA